MTRIAFIDTETTSLNPRTRKAWEVGFIIRDPDMGPAEVEHHLFIDVALDEADPISLKIGGYYDRHPAPYSGFSGSSSFAVYSEATAASIIARELRGATLVGAVPDFDSLTLTNLLLDNGLVPTWHYHLVDVETLAAGALRMPPPWNFDAILRQYGITQPEKSRHTALGDAYAAMALYDAVMAA